jgi:hypothetical protein
MVLAIALFTLTPILSFGFDLSVYSRDDGVEQENVSSPRIYIQNKGNETLHGFYLLYYFSSDSDTPPMMEDDDTPISDVSLVHIGEGQYGIRFDYSDVTLSPGQTVPDMSGESVSIHNEDWSVFDTSDDYSSIQSSLFTLNSKIDVFDSDGNCIYGGDYHPYSTTPVEPGTPVVRLEFRNDAGNSRQQTTIRLRMLNTGTASLRDFKVYYYFTAEENKVPKADEYYLPYSTVETISLGGNDYCVMFDYTGFALLPFTPMPDMYGNSVGLHYEDWSEFDPTNDYSFDYNSGDWKLNDKIVVEDAFGDVVFGNYIYPMNDNLSVAPEHSEIVTDLPNVPMVDPTTGIREISPPEPNLSGSAELNYPILLPKPLGGFSPTISLSYSSERTDGNCGKGWNIATSSISLDTIENGVPDYSDDYLVYNLDGSKLTKWKTTSEGVVYRLRREGAFLKIVQRTDNSFLISYPNGTKAYYGLDDDSRISDPEEPTHIGAWLVSKEVDIHGN